MIVALRVLIVLMLACLPVRAEEEMEFDVDIDTRFVCDTQTQWSGSSRCIRAMLLRPCPRGMASRKIRRPAMLRASPTFPGDEVPAAECMPATTC